MVTLGIWRQCEEQEKKSLIPLILDHLKKETPFSNEAMVKGQIFVGK